MSDLLSEHANQAERERTARNQTDSKHLIITVHGIRTYGNWQRDLTKLLEDADPGVSVLNYTYGYFSSIAFLFPPLRWLVARQFRKVFVHAIRNSPEGTRIDLVAHSFGTYLAASALPSIPSGRSLNTIIFAGSVLRPSFPWYQFQSAPSPIRPTANQSPAEIPNPTPLAPPIRRVVNECGYDDSILLLCQFAALMMGMAGRIGFRGLLGENFVNRYYRFDHGGYFDAQGRFMRESWIPLLMTDDPIPSHDDRPPLTALEGFKLFLMDNLQFIKMAGALMMALIIILLPLDWWRKLEYQKRNERFTHIAKLANSMKIPGTDPSHVLNLLRLDAIQNNAEGHALDQLVGGEVSPGGDDLELAADANDEAEPTWWERLLSLRGGDLEATRARLLHARANYQLAAGKQGRAGDLSKAKLLYEDAIRCYKRVNNDDPANGSYALCLMDYGALLRKMGMHPEALKHFRMVREDVFPVDEKGERPTMPQSLVVDSFCGEASALRDMDNWDEAKARFMNAREKAGKDDALTSYVDNEIAWLCMERLNVAKAVDRFKLAEESCEKLVEGGQFIFTTRLYHIRHGLAMAQRLKGHPLEAYNQYDQLVDEMKGRLKKDFNFNPKERRDLWERLINSMERRADVLFFARQPSYVAAPTLAAAVQHPSLAARDDELAHLKAIEYDYDKALEEVRNDDLPTKTRLLYKKVITHVLGELKGASGRDPSIVDMARGLRGTVDIEFAEAEGTYNALPLELKKGLKLYHQIADCCMKIARPIRLKEARPFTQAVVELRELTIQNAAHCETIDREHVEMLLVAVEILLEPGVEEKGSPQNIQDAARLLAILGASKATTHNELQPYLDRFTRIAAAKMADRPAIAAAPKPPEYIASAPIPPERVLFFLRLPNNRSLTVAEGGANPSGRVRMERMAKYPTP